MRTRDSAAPNSRSRLSGWAATTSAAGSTRPPRVRWSTLRSTRDRRARGRSGRRSVIAGATKPEQVRANAAAEAWDPTAEDLAALRASSGACGDRSSSASWAV